MPVEGQFNGQETATTHAAYILDTFPIVRRHDKAAFGHYRTKDMILAYYNALAAGDTSTDVAV